MGTASRGPGEAWCVDLDRTDHVDYLDVERRLCAALPGQRVDLLVARARERGIPARMMWHWLERYDADLLALVIGRADRPPIEAPVEAPVEAPAARRHLRLV